jgi:glycosyltransferase involved in cell wall biosynthesis
VLTRTTPLGFDFGRVARKVARRVQLFVRGEHPRHFFDVHDRELVNGLLHRYGLSPLAGRVRDVVRDADPIRGEAVYELRDDVRAAIPLALTPAQRGAFLAWFLEHGRRDTDASPLDVLRMLVDLDADPGRGLVQSYLHRPDWQARFPHALTRFGWDTFKQWVAAENGVRGRWLRTAGLAPRYGPWDELALLRTARPELAAGFPDAAALAGDPAPVLKWVWAHQLPHVDREWEDALASEIRSGLPRALGANVVGLFRYPSGLQQVAAATVEALHVAGVRTELRDVPMPFNRDGRPRRGFDGLEPFPVTIQNTGLDLSAAEAYRLAALHPRPGVYRVGVWWWELEQLPREWLDRGAGVDELWAPTSFIAGALRPLGKPVFPMLPSVELPAFDPLPKSAVGLDPDKFTFLFVFDMNSRMPRKNPLGLVRAFRAAFRPAEPVELVIKVGPQEKAYPDWWRDLRAACAANGVTLIDRSLPRDRLLALMNAADAYVSLHRSEGLGLTMAESMLLGKPVIATGYSGNLDFMTPENSYLVGHEKTTIAVDLPPYPRGCVWAEPSTDHAAELMRRVVEHPDDARGVAARGRAGVLELLAPAAAGARMAARLADIHRRWTKGGG